MMPKKPRLTKRKAFLLTRKTFVAVTGAVYVFVAVNFTKSIFNNDLKGVFDELVAVGSTDNGTSSTTGITSKIPFHNHLFKARNFQRSGADGVWDVLIQKGAEIMKENDYAKHLVTLEVGANRAKQSIDAAKAKFHVHLFEPSPFSFKATKRDMYSLTKEYEEINSYVHLHNVAVGSKTGDTLNFTATTYGGTGDHVGEFDMWNMKRGRSTDEKIDDYKKGSIIQVPTMKLDDLILHHTIDGEAPIDEVFALKIDTQGFEPQVFAGLKESIKNHKIKYIISEFWPNGMALIGDRTDKCNLVMETVEPLISAGYSVYALPIVAHPKISEVVGNLDWQERPFDDLRADCEYMLDLEKRFPFDDYHMGYWADYVFVAPNTPLLVA